MQGIGRIVVIGLMVLVAATAKAQSPQQTQSLQSAKSRFAFVAESDTTSVFQGFSLNFDLIGPLQNVLSDHGQYEAGVRVNILDRYFPALEVGVGKADHVDDYDETVTFKTSAPYFRIGCDYNILKNKHDLYRMYAGARYCFSSFTYNENDVDDNKGNCHWLEGVFGVDAEVWKNFHLGWDVRYKRKLFHSEADGTDPWYIPGMGKNNNAQLWGRFLVMLEF